MADVYLFAQCTTMKTSFPDVDQPVYINLAFSSIKLQYIFYILLNFIKSWLHYKDRKSVNGKFGILLRVSVCVAFVQRINF